MKNKFKYRGAYNPPPEDLGIRPNPTPQPPPKKYDKLGRKIQGVINE